MGEEGKGRKNMFIFSKYTIKAQVTPGSIKITQIERGSRAEEWDREEQGDSVLMEE